MVDIGSNTGYQSFLGQDQHITELIYIQTKSSWFFIYGTQYLNGHFWQCEDTSVIKWVPPCFLAIISPLSIDKSNMKTIHHGIC